MGIMKKALACITIAIILLGTVAKPVSVNAATSIFGRSWFYNYGEDSGGLYFDGRADSSDMVAEDMYDKYLWYYKIKNGLGAKGGGGRGGASSSELGQEMYNFLYEKGSDRDIPTARNQDFRERFVTGSRLSGPRYVYDESGEETLYRIDTQSPYIYFVANAEDCDIIEGSASIKSIPKRRDIRMYRPLSYEVSNAIMELYEILDDSFDYFKEYYIDAVETHYLPSEMAADFLGYDKEVVVEAIKNKVASVGRGPLESAYVGMVANLAGGEEYGADSIGLYQATLTEQVEYASGFLYSAYRNNNYFPETASYYPGGGEFTYISYLSEGENEIGEKNRQWISDVLSSMNIINKEAGEFFRFIYRTVPSALARYSGADTYASEVGEPGSIEQSLAEFVRSIGGQLSSKLADDGITLNTIVYGRVRSTDGLSVPVNYYTFELQKKNPYGLVGARIFAIFRTLLMLGVLVYAMFHFVKSSFISVLDARTWAKIKSDGAYILGSLILLFAMPNLLDAVMFARDKLLGFIGGAFDSGLSVTGSALLTAVQSGRFIDAAEYFGMVLLSVYFAFAYIAAACSMMVMFAFFPLFILFGFADKKRIIGSWAWFMLGVIMIPLIDACLLIVPLIAAEVGMPTLAQIILCMSIIPTRGVVRSMMGFGKSVGAEIVGIGALMAAGRALGGAAMTAKNAITGTAAGIEGAHEDLQTAKAYEERAHEEGQLRETALKSEFAERGLFHGGAGVSSDALEFGGKGRPYGMDQDYFGQRTDDDGNLTRIASGQNRGTAGMLKPAFSSAGGGSGSYSLSGSSGRSSNELMAQMYRKRAITGATRAVGATVLGTYGAVKLGALGAAGGMMLGPTAALSGAGMGMSLGGELGGAVGGVGGAAFGAGLGAFASAVDRLPDEEQAQARAEDQEYLTEDNNLAYEMYSGDLNEDINALNDSRFIQAQEKRFANCQNDEQLREELSYQNAIIARASRNTLMASGGEASAEQQKKIMNSSFYKGYSQRLDAYRGAIGDSSYEPQVSEGYRYYSPTTLRNWQNSMFTTNRDQAKINLNDHAQSNRMGMMLRSAQEHGLGSAEYRNAVLGTQKTIAYNSGALQANHPTYVSNSFEAGRVWNRFDAPGGLVRDEDGGFPYPEPEPEPTNGIPATGEGSTHDILGDHPTATANQRLPKELEDQMIPNNNGNNNGDNPDKT